MLLAELDGKYAGCASLSMVSPFRRYQHRCSIAIALYKEFWGLGLGRVMLSSLLEEARVHSYEQAELSVDAANSTANTLYRSLGFVDYGTLPKASRFGSDQYSNQLFMVKQLED